MKSTCIVCGDEKVHGVRNQFPLCKTHWDAAEKEDRREASDKAGFERMMEQQRFRQEYPETWNEAQSQALVPRSRPPSMDRMKN